MPYGAVTTTMDYGDGETYITCSLYFTETWHGQVLDKSLLLFGPRCYAAHQKHVCLINLLLDQAKMSIWLTRRSTLKEIRLANVELVFKDLVVAFVRLVYPPQHYCKF